MDLNSLIREAFKQNDLAEQQATFVQQHFSALDNLLKQPLLRDSLRDMARYPAFIESCLKDIFKIDATYESTREAQRTLFLAANAIRSGAACRSAGVLSAIEDVPDRFSSARGGLQQAVLAAEYIPTIVYWNLIREPGPKTFWEGFLTAGAEEYPYHSASVVILPTANLLKPESWWTLYHELAHAVMVSEHWIFEADSFQRVIARFLEGKSNPKAWRRRLDDILAELLGFELGFFGDFPLFNQLVWPLLAEGSHVFSDRSETDLYLIRMYFVKLYDQRMKTGEPWFWPNEDDIFQELSEYILETASLCEVMNPTLAEGFKKDRYFIASNLTSFLVELSEVAAVFHEIARDMKLNMTRARMGELEDNNTEEVRALLRQGKPYWGVLKSPQALFYWLFKEQSCDAAQSIATIRTLAAQQESLLDSIVTRYPLER